MLADVQSLFKSLMLAITTSLLKNLMPALDQQFFAELSIKQQTFELVECNFCNASILLCLTYVTHNKPDIASTKVSDTLSSLCHTLRIKIASDSSILSLHKFCFCSVMPKNVIWYL